VAGRQHDDQIAMKRRGGGGQHDQTSIRRARERLNGAFDLVDLADIDRLYVHPKQRRQGLDDAELADSGRDGRVPNDGRRITPGAICLSSSSHFPAKLYSNDMNPVAFHGPG
jgi:hypothetical protein